MHLRRSKHPRRRRPLARASTLFLAAAHLGLAQAEVPRPADNASPPAADVEAIARHEADPARYSELYRPQYHFTSIRGDANDPNGLAVFRGQWHFFYQYFEHGGISWGHAISDDLLHWQHRPRAIYTDPFGQPMSGGGIVDTRNVSGRFPDGPGLMLFYTWGRSDHNGRRERQALAYSQDGVLFKKHPDNPLVPELRHQPGMADQSGFRDPKIIWHAPTGRYVMVVGGGPLRIYSSTDLLQWRFESENHDIQAECPDLFPLPVDGDPANTRWVVSKAGRHYVVGEFDGHAFKPLGAPRRLAWGHDAYASQSWSDVPDRRRLWTTKLFRAHIDQGFPAYTGVDWWTGKYPVPFSIPMELSLRTTEAGVELFQTPAREIESLRRDTREWRALDLRPGDNPLSDHAGRSVELDAEFVVPADSPPARFGFKVFKDKSGWDVEIGYDTARAEVYMERRGAAHITVGNYAKRYAAPLPLAADRSVRLRVFIDVSTVEIFAGDGRRVIQNVVYPHAAGQGLEFFTEGGGLRLDRLALHRLATVWRTPEEERALKPSLRMPAWVTLTEGEETWFSARLFPEEATDSITWTLSDPEAAELAPFHRTTCAFAPSNPASGRSSPRLTTPPKKPPAKSP